jgi:hypothetical protein
METQKLSFQSEMELTARLDGNAQTVPIRNSGDSDRRAKILFSIAWERVPLTQVVSGMGHSIGMGVPS